MKIGIDFRLANISNRGMASYCREIVSSVVIDSNSDNEYILFIDEHPHIFFSQPNVRQVRMPKLNYIISEQLLLPLFIKKYNCDVFWSPNNTFPIFLSKKVKLIVTIHDLIFFYGSKGKSTIKQRIGKVYRKLILKYFSQKIDACLTVSEFSKNEIMLLLNLKCPIKITYNSIEDFEHKVADINYTIVTDDFFFTVSGDAPSKNLPTLIKVFQQNFPNQKLVIAGVPQNSSIRNQQTDNIIMLKHNLSDDELISYYSHCKCFLFVSKYEGFGRPLLEAMIFGKPIIASNVCSIPEVLHGKGILTEPSEAAITQSINKLLSGVSSSIFDYSESINAFRVNYKNKEIFLSIVELFKQMQ